MRWITVIVVGLAALTVGCSDEPSEDAIEQAELYCIMTGEFSSTYSDEYARCVDRNVSKFDKEN